MPLDEDDDAVARAPGSMEELRVWLVQTSAAARHGGSRSRGIQMNQRGRWSATVQQHRSRSRLALTFTTRAAAQEVRDAACTIMGYGCVLGNSNARPAGFVLQSGHARIASCSLLVM